MPPGPSMRTHTSSFLRGTRRANVRGLIGKKENSHDSTFCCNATT